MKTQKLYFLTIFALFLISDLKAQVTQALNGISSTSYVGTSNDFDVVFKRQAVNAGLLSFNKTSFGLNSLAMPNGVSLGNGAGQFSSGIGGNTYLGNYAGRGESINVQNSGRYNTFIGSGAAEFNTTGSFNIAIGLGAGKAQSSGNNNIFIGNSSGCEDEGSLSGSIFIGSYAGFTQCTSNTLVIDNEENDKPLILGDFALNQLKFNAKVGIGYNFGNYPTTAGAVDVSGYNLFVKGGILTEEVRVSLQSTWADYVFSKDYKLPSLSDLEDFIETNGHLPNVPSAQKVKEDGIELGEMAKIQQEKIEELTLYIIEQNKINEKQSKEIQELKGLVETLISKK